jgi:hypothetical protein
LRSDVIPEYLALIVRSSLLARRREALLYLDHSHTNARCEGKSKRTDPLQRHVADGQAARRGDGGLGHAEADVGPLSPALRPGIELALRFEQGQQDEDREAPVALDVAPVPFAEGQDVRSFGVADYERRAKVRPARRWVP